MWRVWHHCVWLRREEPNKDGCFQEGSCLEKTKRRSQGSTSYLPCADCGPEGLPQVVAESCGSLTSTEVLTLSLSLGASLTVSPCWVSSWHVSSVLSWRCSVACHSADMLVFTALWTPSQDSCCVRLGIPQELPWAPVTTSIQGFVPTPTGMAVIPEGTRTYVFIYPDHAWYAPDHLDLYVGSVHC